MYKRQTMSNLPKDLRTKLSEFFPLETVKIFDRQISLDGTRKYVVTLADGSLVETVGMPVYLSLIHIYKIAVQG